MPAPTALLTSRTFAGPSLGKVWLVEYVGAGVFAFTQLAVPPDAIVTTYRPAFVGVGRSTFILGMFSIPVVKHRNGLLYRVGIRTPPAPGAGSWNLTAAAGTTNYVGAIAYRHRMDTSDGNLIIAESSMSRSTNVVTGGVPRTWSNLPTNPPDTRVTHIVGYLSIAGGELEEAWEAPIGTTTVNESETAFGEAGNTLREPPPLSCKYGEFFANSLWLAGDPKNPARVYRSQQDEPEAFDSATGFLDLPDHEVITGMKRAGNTLLVFGERCCYAITGFGILTGDYTIDKISPAVGTISHHSLVNIDERVWFVSHEGVYMWDGQRFRYMMDDIRTFFRDDLLSDYPAYRNCHAVDRKVSKMYELLIPKSTGNFSYAGYYLPMFSGDQAQPDWFFKSRPRYEYALGILRVGADIPRTYITDTVGFVRQEVEFTGGTDDDGLPLDVVIQTRLEYGEGSIPTGDERTGKRWVGVDSYLRVDNAKDGLIQLQGFGGDESAVDSEAPSFDTTLEPGVLPGFVAKERYFRIPEALTGDGVSLKWMFSSPTAHTKFKGYRLAWVPGEAARLPIAPALKVARLDRPARPALKRLA